MIREKDWPAMVPPIDRPLELLLIREYQQPAPSASEKSPKNSMRPAGPMATSIDARYSVAGRALDARSRVLSYIEQRGSAGATDEEVRVALGMRVQTQTPRRGELVKLGLIRDSGRRRPTSTGRAAVVWVATPEAGHAR
ncbi:MAG: hypothetical protein HRF43_09805 [Phycisphaerae bacterium]|jgi:hypothetical protein